MEKDNLCSKAGTTNRMIDRNSHKNKNQTNHKNHSSDSSRIKQISFLLFILCLFATNIITAQTSGYTGTCKWELTGTSPNYTLTISPTNGISGAMADYTSGSTAPWYSNRANIKTLIIEQGVTHIGNFAFYDYPSLTGSLTIPNSVTTIGNYAFRGCSNLTGSLTIPNSVTTIGDFAFQECSGFTGSLTISSSVTSIGHSAFYKCRNLTGSLVLPNSVTYIGTYAFAYCVGLTGSLVIPNSLTSIEMYTFAYCTGFTGSLTIPNWVTSIGAGAFNGWTQLTNVTIPNSVTSIGAGAFGNCTQLTSVIIPNSVTDIVSSTFSGCTSLTSVTIPKSVATIGNMAFSNCSGLTEIYVKRNNPPAIGGSLTFDNVPTNIPVYVPCNRKSVYQGANYWKNFTNIIDNLSLYDILPQVNDETMGSVDVTYSCANNTATIQANPNPCYYFVQWSDGNTQNPRNIVVTSDITLTAEFAPSVVSVTVTNQGPVCAGSDRTLTYSSNPAGTVEWTSDNTSVATVNVTTGVVHGVSAGTATITCKVTTTAGCTGSATYTITVYPKPLTGTLNGASAVCIGSTVTLTSTVSNGVWKSEDISKATVNGGAVTGVSAGEVNIWYVITNSSGCSDSVSKTVTVTPLSTSADITADGTTVCYGATATLTAGSNIPGAAYKWYDSQTGYSLLKNEPAYTTPALTATATYYVSVSGTGYCENAENDRKAVTVTVLPQLIPGTISQSQTVVSGQSPAEIVSLTAASGIDAYQWQQSGDGTYWTDIADATSETYSPPPITALTYYRRKGTGGTACEAYSNGVVIFPVKPLALKYVACPGASVTGGFYDIPQGVSFDWYGAESGGTSTGSGNPISVIKDATPLQTAWAEPKYNGVSYPRIRVDLELGDCGVLNPAGCAVTGTVLFKEDFGGNDPNAQPVKQNGIPQVVGYEYHADPRCAGTNGCYSILKRGQDNGVSWYRPDDHTYPDDFSRGYFMEVDASGAPGQFYIHEINNLCAGTKLYFSMWLTSVDVAVSQNHTNHIFVLEDPDGNILAQYYTGNVPDADPDWKQYGFEFTVPQNISSIVLRVINNSDGSMGNDFAMDDIEVRLCAPEVNIIRPAGTSAFGCTGSSFVFEGSYTDDATFGNSLVYRWEYSSTGDINSPAAWIPVTSTRGTSVTGTVNSVYTVNSVSAADAGYYRLAVANAANIDNYNCRAMSDIIHLEISAGVVSGTATGDQTVCSNTVPATLTATESTGGSAPLTYQWQQSTDGGSTWPDVSAGTGGTTRNYTPPPLTQTTQYRLKTVGGTAPCETVYSNAVTLTVLSPLSGKYIACPDASVTVGFSAIAGVDLYWYDVQTGGTDLGSGNTKTVTKDATAVQTWWVEPRSNGVSYPRIRVDLELGDCGVTDPQGCAATGTILYKEDFGGNNPNDPDVKPEGIDQVVGYTYNGTGLGDTKYGIRKLSTPYPTFGQIDDHTYPSDNTRGYLLQIDASHTPGQFYECQIDNLCSGMKLYFSAWITSVQLWQNVVRPNHIFLVEDTDGNLITQYNTGDIPNNDVRWKQYGFPFTIPYGQSSIVLKIINNGAGANGNDFVMDDIEVRLCTPPVTLTQPNNMDTTLCVGDSYTLTGNYTDDATFGNSLVSRWEYNFTDDINNPNAWAAIPGTTINSTNGIIENEYIISPVSLSNTGYYRMAVANAANIGNYNCRSMSDIIHVHVITGAVSGTAGADQTICSNTVPATLTATAATGDNLTFTYQWQQSTDSGDTWTDVIGGTGGTTLNYAPPALTQTTLYRLLSSGGTDPCKKDTSNTVTVTVSSTQSYPDIRIRVCPDAGDINLAKYIDTVDNITDIQWAHQISGIPVSSPEGTVSTGNLAFSRIHTLTYTVTSRCVSEQKRKVYLEVLRDGRMRPLKDTVEICHLQAGAVQINQLFGIEAGGTWSWNASGNIDAYIAQSTTPTYSGAVVMNGKGIYEDSSIPFITYHGVNKAKAVKFTYTADSSGCLKGREYSIVVVLTED